MKRPAAILFDCDGVLADTELVGNSIVAEEMTLRGWPMTPAEARETFLGMALPDMLPRIEARVGLLPPEPPRLLHITTRTTPSVLRSFTPLLSSTGAPAAAAAESGEFKTELGAKGQL